MTIKTGAALLFDIDGTLADTDEFHREAYNEAMKPWGEVFDLDRYAREIQGFTNADITARLLPNEPIERRLELSELKEATFRRLVQGQVRPKPGLMALLDRADAAGVPMAAVTNAPRPNAELMLGALGITHRFRRIVIGDELPHGKPHPLPYLEGLRATNGRAEHALAFEDSRSGIRAAVDAQVATIGLAASGDHAQLVESGAVAAVDDFNDATVAEWLRQRLGL
ncbi:MAG: HAD-IA family hydrolase [Alphaproteobacteria bacterium]|nr:HAD-IA family hydrolase [Alphaproteobacteria bacterium]